MVHKTTNDTISRT